MYADGGGDADGQCPGVDGREFGWLGPGASAVLGKKVGVGAPLCVRLSRVLERPAERGVVGGFPCEYVDERACGEPGRDEAREFRLPTPP